MKKFILSLVTFMVLFSSCQKRRCKDQQVKDMAALQVELQQELSNSNLTSAQIAAIKARYDAKEKEVLAECN